MPPSENGSSIQERAANGVGVDPQEAMFDRQLDDDDLEAALEEREQLRQQKLDAAREFRTADDAAKAQLLRFQLAVGEVARIGRFRIKRTSTPPRHVAFDTEGSERLTIQVAERP